MVLSKGHTCPALYAMLAEKGFFPKEELTTFRAIGSRLQGHPDMNKAPGIDFSAGSLGQGVSAACGMALAGKLGHKDYRVYTILGDGEIEEGQVWEAAMFADHYKLDNLCFIIDNNDLQIDGRVGEVSSPYPIDEKFRAFGFEVFWPRLHRVGGDIPKGTEGDRQAGSDHCQDYKGQGCQLHGRPGGLARQGPQ